MWYRLSAESHLNEAERVVLLHQALDSAADLLQPGLVLTDPGDVLLNGRAVCVPVSAAASSKPADETQDFGL